jgi:uncharacterized protein (DUF488 family)
LNSPSIYTSNGPGQDRHGVVDSISRVYSIGHSTRSTDELVEMLKDAGVTSLADVRAIPRSRTNPHFNKDALATALGSQSIDYRHFPALGGRRSAASAPRTRNDFWRIQSFRNYADYAQTTAFQQAFSELELMSRARPTAFMCAEAVWWRCHRRLIADYFLVRGWDVIHLMAPGQTQPAVLTSAAVAGSDGTISYPASPDGALPFDRM